MFFLMNIRNYVDVLFFVYNLIFSYWLEKGYCIGCIRLIYRLCYLIFKVVLFD